MKRNIFLYLSYVFSVSGIALSISDIESICSIVCTIICGLCFLVNIAIKFYNYIKDGKLTKEEIEDLEKDLDDLKKM